MKELQIFKITGLTCVACTKLSAKRIKDIAGVQAATVDLTSGKAELSASRKVALSEIKTVLTGSSYDAEEYHD